MKTKTHGKQHDKAKPKPLQFVNVGVRDDGQGHYLLNPACVNGYFKPGDKCLVTVESYPAST